MMIAVYYIHLFMGNLLTGYVGGLYGTMPNTTFWFLHVALMGIAAVLLLAARIAFGSFLVPKVEEPLAA
jgi:POT family proton-dependent oligopeptide transporter